MSDNQQTPDHDSIALEAAREIALMWGLTSSQYVAKIQVRVLEAIRAATLRQQAGAVDESDLLRETLPYLRDEAANYEDDGSNEPLELARRIEAALARPASSDEVVSLVRQLRVAVREDSGAGASKEAFDKAQTAEANLIAAIRALARPASSEPASGNCASCDGTGDVHRADGEWLGHCKQCEPASGEAVRYEIRFVDSDKGLPRIWYLITRERYEAELKQPSEGCEVRALYPHPAEPVKVPEGWRESFVELLEDYAGSRAEVAVWNVTQRVQPEGGIRFPRPRLAKLMAHVDLLAAAPGADGEVPSEG